MAKTMTGGEMVIRALVDQGVKHLFGYPGGAILPIYDELHQQDQIQHILVRHEQGAVHAAEGYARSTGKVGVVLVTSGPGATNAVTGLTDALMDSIPVVVLTGQVPTFMIGTDGFQEADTVGITRPCTKHNWLVKETDRLADTLHQVAPSGVADDVAQGRGEQAQRVQRLAQVVTGSGKEARLGHVGLLGRGACRLDLLEPAMKLGVGRSDPLLQVAVQHFEVGERLVITLQQHPAREQQQGDTRVGVEHEPVVGYRQH